MRVCAKHDRHSRAFTLVELLGVMIIIMILAAILLPATTKVRNAAWRARARDTAHQLVAVWKASPNAVP